MQFYQAVEQNPHKVAIEYGQRSITYLELDLQSNLIANWLIDNGYKQGSHLGIFLEDRIQIITLILASLKSGCVFVPFDAQYPLERISVMVQIVNLAVIFTDLTNAALAAQALAKETSKPEIIIIEPFLETLANGNRDRPTIETHPDANAYIYFTSGSTGKPKGVLGRYKGLVHFIRWEIKMLEVTADFRATQFASPGFDAFLRDVFVPICAGGTLCIPEKRDLVLDINKLVSWLEQSRINLIHCVPSIFRSFSLYPLNAKNFSDLEYIVMAGERITPGDVKHWYDIFGERVQLVNFYGPTETTLIKTAYFIQKEDSIKRTIPIGKPMEGARILIADAELIPCKLGIIGEIYIRTPYMSLGYTDPDLTNEKFIQNPYSNQPGDLMYRTGDLGRWMPDGNLEYIGRIDNQIKIHGVRIEPGEIEIRLKNHPGIHEVVVINRETQQGNQYLCAYYVANADISPKELRQSLSGELPEYMIPSSFIRLLSFPLTSSGKIDRKALPESVGTALQYLAPTNEVEAELQQIWAQVLGHEKSALSIEDNFFLVGGHSLAAIKLVYLAGAHGWPMKIQDIFDYPTIQGQAAVIQSKLTQVAETTFACTQLVSASQKEASSCSTSKADNFASVPSLAPVFTVEKRALAPQKILLTGATGFLGIHLLHDLLSNTHARVYCLLRGASQTLARARFAETINFYFAGESRRLAKLVDERIIILNGDVSEDNLGLSDTEYHELIEEIDTVLHAAALVKHFGDFAEFAKANISGTQNVIEFARAANASLHHISTVGISGSLVPGEEDVLFTEQDFYIGQDYAKKVYTRSKFLAENTVLQAMAVGLKASIHRVGNLTGRYSDGHFQKNIAENAFYTRLKGLLDLGVVPAKALGTQLQFTPVDLCSKAIVEIMQTREAVKRIFHIYNHQTIALGELVRLLAQIGIPLAAVSAEEFSASVRAAAGDMEKLTALGLLNEYLATKDENYTALVNIDSTLTCKYLSAIGFSWPRIDVRYILQIFGYMQAAKFL